MACFRVRRDTGLGWSVVLPAGRPQLGFPVTSPAVAGEREPYSKMVSGMKFVVSIQQDEDGTYIADCPSIPGCVSQGQTEAEAEANIADAIREGLAVRAELGMRLSVTPRAV